MHLSSSFPPPVPRSANLIVKVRTGSSVVTLRKRKPVIGWCALAEAHLRYVEEDDECPSPRGPVVNMCERGVFLCMTDGVTSVYGACRVVGVRKGVCWR